jgi:hypothetical protein
MESNCQLNRQQRRPSVISINGVVASLAVVEAMFLLSGVGTSRKVITYRGSPGWVTYADPAMDECYYCAIWNDRTPPLSHQSE